MRGQTRASMAPVKRAQPEVTLSFVAGIGSSARRLVPAPGGLSRRIRPLRASTRSEADQAGAVGEVSAADAVVADCDAQDVVVSVGVDGDRDGRGVRVLGRVGERLGDDIVGRDLDRLRQPARRARQRRPGRRSGGRAPSAQAPARLRRGSAGGFHGRARAAPPGRRSVRLRERPAERPARRAQPPAPRGAEAQCHQPLLGAVVQVPLDTAACLVGGGHDPRP